jgi:hypothetical protein
VYAFLAFSGAWRDKRFRAASAVADAKRRINPINPAHVRTERFFFGESAQELL